MAENGDKMHKPAYDGRLEYYKHLRSHMDNIYVASVNQDYDLWLRMLWAYYSIVQPYIKPDESGVLRDLLNKAEEKNDALNKINKRLTGYNIAEKQIKILLRNIQIDLFNCSKYMLLPISEDDGDDWNEDDFFKGTDS